jgi:hypothetical protein
MANAKVVNLRQSTNKAKQCPGQYDDAHTEARELLEGTIASLDRSDGETDVCHLAAVEKAKAALERMCDAATDGNYDGLNALSLVELARLALEVGLTSFDGRGYLSYGHSIGEALQAALDRLQAGMRSKVDGCH